jgi:ribosome-associated protein
MSSRIAVIARESIQVHNRLAIPLEEIELRYSRSSGPGGQHAQKTETRVEALFDVEASRTLSAGQKERIRRRAGPVVRALAQDERSRLRNQELALERLAKAVRSALHVPRKRRPTTPSAAVRERRLENKRRRAQTKRLRRPPAE